MNLVWKCSCALPSLHFLGSVCKLTGKRALKWVDGANCLPNCNCFMAIARVSCALLVTVRLVHLAHSKRSASVGVAQVPWACMAGRGRSGPGWTELKTLLETESGFRGLFTNNLASRSRQPWCCRAEIARTWLDQEQAAGCAYLLACCHGQKCPWMGLAPHRCVQLNALVMSSGLPARPQVHCMPARTFAFVLD
jgi:hypothetical protein